MKSKFSAVVVAALLAGCQSCHHGEPPQVAENKSEAQPEKAAAAPLIVPNDVEEIVLPPEDLWARLRQNMALDAPEHERVQRFRDWYLKHPKHLKTVTERAAPFLYLILEEIERRQLPVELALLPIVESSFDVFAYSHGAAAGVWQFTSPMAKHFGLQQNWWYDGRRDVYAATIAAMDMMEYLHKKLDNNWHYALAAYNTGEGRVFRAIRKNRAAGKPTDFFSLDLPTETERYVPQLLALSDVIKNAEKYGVELYPIKNEAVIERVEIDSQIDLAMAADLAGLSLAELQKLNPGYNRWATAPEGPHALLLPLDKAEQFKLKLAQTDPEERIKWVRYQVQPGDSLGVIAEKHHTRIGIIQSVNKLDDNLIRVGQPLLIPVASKDQKDYVFSAPERLNRKQSVRRGSFKYKHKVKAGDSLWTIARANNVSVAQLASWNGMAPKDTLRLGQELVIWQARGKKNANSVMRQVHYKVRSGDSLARIGQKFKVKIKDLIRWNQLEGKKYLQPGQKLKLYVDVTQISS